ncbi:MAG: hypothetical protein AVDCRST_MAG49-1723, partial [uncultured Thermomicrobiales bacterium]
VVSRHVQHSARRIARLQPCPARPLRRRARGRSRAGGCRRRRTRAGTRPRSCPRDVDGACPDAVAVARPGWEAV